MSIRTAARGSITFQQDITKGPAIWSWVPDSGVADDPYPNDGSGGMICYTQTANDTFVYQQRDGVDVLRISLDYSASTSSRYFHPLPLRHVELRSGVRMSAKMYMDSDIYTMLGFWGNFNLQCLNTFIDNEPGYKGIQLNHWKSVDGVLSSGVLEIYGRDTWVNPGWVEVIVEYYPDGTYRGKCWQPPGESEPDSWDGSVPNVTLEGSANYRTSLTLYPYSSCVFDLAYIKAEEIL